MSKFWLWDFVWGQRGIRRSPENYAAYVRKSAAEPPSAYFLQNSARASGYPEGPDGGWRYKFERLPVHDQLLARQKREGRHINRAIGGAKIMTRYKRSAPCKKFSSG